MQNRLQTNAGTLTGSFAHHHAVKGDGLKPRDVIVWLPPNYEFETKRRYPVLYVHDGQNLFDPQTAYTGIDWGIHRTAESLIAGAKMAKSIIVGIYNSDDRLEEYSLTEKGSSYMAFVVRSLKPLIDAIYRTKPGRSTTATMGSSMGGLISFLLVWQHSRVFGGAACMSPAFWAQNYAAVELVQRTPRPPKPLRLYLDNGGRGGDERLQPGCDAMLKALAAKGIRRGDELRWFLDRDGEHNERTWGARAWRPLHFLLS